MKQETKTMLYATGFVAAYVTVILWVAIVIVALFIEHIPEIVEWLNTNRELVTLVESMTTSFLFIWTGLFMLYISDSRRKERAEK